MVGDEDLAFEPWYDRDDDDWSDDEEEDEFEDRAFWDDDDLPEDDSDPFQRVYKDGVQ